MTGNCSGETFCKLIVGSIWKNSFPDEPQKLFSLDNKLFCDHRWQKGTIDCNSGHSATFFHCNFFFSLCNVASCVFFTFLVCLLWHWFFCVFYSRNFFALRRKSCIDQISECDWLIFGKVSLKKKVACVPNIPAF